MAALRDLIHTAFQTISSHLPLTTSLLALLLITYHFILHPLLLSHLSAIPGPPLFALTKWRLALSDLLGTRTPLIHALHQRYGPAVRIGPREVSFSSLAALRTIYGAGSGSHRTAFYRMFDVYGRPNLFTFASPAAHGARKKVLAHAYAKSAILAPTGIAKPLVERTVADFVRLVERDPAATHEIFVSLHCFSLDAITGFLYGQVGGTHALRGDAPNRALLTDILDHRRRRLSWFAVHLPGVTRWLYGRTGWVGALVARLGLLPMSKPATYTGIRAHALRAWIEFEAAAEKKGAAGATTQDGPEPIIAKLQRHARSGKLPRLDGLDIASEAADHFLAGIDTTSDTLLFLVWQLSRPENGHYLRALLDEVDAIPPEGLTDDGVVRVEVADKLPYLDALLKETLRLHAALPASEPRDFPDDTEVDGYKVPKGTTVSMAPYTLHRAEAFLHPGEWRPERWLGELGNVGEMKKWFWAFSSGGRTCIGIHLAMAEMTTFVATLYRKYTTVLQSRQKGLSPGITSRFEVFYDESFERVSEHECWVKFVKR